MEILANATTEIGSSVSSETLFSEDIEIVTDTTYPEDVTSLSDTDTALDVETSEDFTLNAYTELESDSCYTLQDVIDKQNDIYEQSERQTYFLAGILFAIVLAIGSCFAYLFGSWIWSLIRC